MTMKTHHVTAYITMAITIALAGLGTVEKDLPVVNDWLMTTAIPNAITILGFAQELVQNRAQGKPLANGITLTQITNAKTALTNITASLSALETSLKGN